MKFFVRYKSLKLGSISVKYVLFTVIFILIQVSFGEITKITIQTRPANYLYGLDVRVPDSPELILALSGGVRGVAHIGVLAALEEAGIPPAGIAGVSIGSLVAGLYSGGMSPDEIRLAIQNIKLETIMLDQPERNSLLLERKKEYSRHLIEVRLSKNLSPILPGAISPGQKLYQRLLELTLNLPLRNINNWNKLPTRLRIMSTDINSGEPIEFSSGDLTPAIRASMSVPLLFEPFDYNSRLLIDGGVSANIPVNTAKAMSKGIVKAIDLTSELENHDQRYKPWQVVNQVTTIMQQQPNSEAQKKADMTIIPEFDDNFSKTDNYDYYFEVGRLAMRERIPEIMELLNISRFATDHRSLIINSVSPHRDTHPEMIRLLISKAKLGSVNDVKMLLESLYNTGLVKDAHAEYDDVLHSILIRITYNPLVNRVSIKSANQLFVTSASSLIEHIEGEILNTIELQLAIISLHKKLRSTGLSASHISAIELDYSTNELTLVVNDGLLGSIIFEGLDKVPQAFLSAEVPIKQGNSLTSAGILKGTINLYATGLFRNVSPVIKSNGDGSTDLIFYIQEHPSPPVRLGLAYQSDRRTHGFLEAVLPNPLTYASRLGLFLSAGEKDNIHHMSFAIDKLFGFPLMSNMSIGYSYHERKRYHEYSHRVIGEYDESRWGGNFKFGGTVTRWGLLAFTARWEEHNNNNFSSENQYNLQGIGVELALDTQDSHPYPTHGLRFDANFESATTNINDGTNFNRFWSSFEGYMPLSERYILGLKTEAKFTERTAPLDEQFKLGGIYDFTGLRLDEKIGTVQMTSGLDLRFDLLSRMLSEAYIGLHTNIGRSWTDPQGKYERDDLLLSIGTYFVFDTILGPLHLEWGQLIPNGKHTRQNVVYFQAGNLF
jgi:predicted acylesterase/phospholipase RssA